MQQVGEKHLTTREAASCAMHVFYWFINVKDSKTFSVPEKYNNFHLVCYFHWVIILDRINNSYISIETLVPQQAGGFIIKYYFQISNITACR